MENIYFRSILKKKIIVDARYLNENLDSYIQDYLRNKVEGKCIFEGYIRPDSVRLLKRSVGVLLGSRFTGDMTYEVAFSADVCNPMEGNVYDCKVKLVNKTGILCSNGPLSIVVGRELHENNMEAFNAIKPNDNIKISVIGRKFALDDKEIKVVGKVYGLDKKNKKPKNVVMEVMKKEEEKVDEDENEDDIDDMEIEDSEEEEEGSGDENSDEEESDEESEEESESESETEQPKIDGNTILKGGDFGDDFSDFDDNDDDVAEDEADDDGDSGYYSD
jgi:DNA-directed RNA polymerase subunit E'/Rpb7